MRLCRPCGVLKPLTEFSIDSNESGGGRRYYCKACAKVKKRIYLEKLKGDSMNLNQAKFNSIFNGLSAIAKKTYEAVPIKSAWDSNQIHTELIRLGIAGDLKTTAGCLNTLVSSGLVSEPTRGTFVRIEVKQKSTAQVASEALKPAAPQTPLDILFSLAGTARQLGQMVQDLAKDIEESALSVSDQMDAESADTQKLKQLQSILKSLG